MILVDSNVWIFLNIQATPEHQAAKGKIEELRTEGIATNIIIVSEVFHQLSRMLGKAESLARVQRILDSADVSYFPLEDRLARSAIHLAATKPVRINDAIIAQQAMVLKIPVLTDNVKDFRKVNGLKVIPLR
ncbi:MAG: type II toxin-antitoxin system VapC family toxin [Candidatus Aenigmarchaeota archaeon]|nr:type II toxin-antitoxin system VapC family toxin [Candidatus Aenigmarchaeota archaeon]